MRALQRPRELRWYHAAGIMFGDWGTSRLYVLGLAFVMSFHSSFWYVAAMCVVVTLVGFAYTIVCAHFPDGGGVYSAAKHYSPNLAVVGALLLIADYTITAAMSAYAGFRYILPDSAPADYAMYAAVLVIIGIGALNTVGPRRVGILALLVGLASMIFYLVLGACCLLKSGPAIIHTPVEPLWTQWSHFIYVILALSGVEAIANMTGVMAEPVAKNARKAILVVLAEVVILNLIMAYAMNALPDLISIAPSQLPEAARADVRDHMVKILAGHYVGPLFAAISALFFGALLISAANTAIGGMISIQFLLARDKELPHFFTKLNRYGVPFGGLIIATALPVIVLLIVGSNLEMLADLYAIGVVGAIAINLTSCGMNRKLYLSRWERAIVLGVGILMCLIELSIAWEKPAALIFASIILGIGLLARHVTRRVIVPAPETPVIATEWHVTVPATMPRLLVPTRGNPKLCQFAISYAKGRDAAVFMLFVREVRLKFRDRGPVAPEHMTLANDQEAQTIFAQAKEMCDQANVPMVPLYAVHDSPAELILDHAATLGVDAVIMGISKRSALWNTLRGDMLREVIDYLPEQIPLLIHA
ncbi:MAG: amino acid permease [Planctomycetota bacterium]